MKTINIFKPEDFIPDIYLPQMRGGYEIHSGVHSMEANRVFNKWLSENSTIVYGTKNEDVWTSDKVELGTRQALVVNIQPIVKCEHKESVYYEGLSKTWWKCRDCGKELKATKWEEV